MALLITTSRLCAFGSDHGVINFHKAGFFELNP